MQFLEAPLFAICGQNKRKVKKKIYGPNDLVSVESQTDETVASVGSQTDETGELVVSQTLESDEIVLGENTEKKLRRMWRKLH
jgi:hypothetical protein